MKKLIPHSTQFPADPAYQALVKKVSKELSDLDLFVRQRATVTYWRIGKYIYEHLSAHKKSAKDGADFFEKFSRDVNRDVSTLQRAVQFYRAYPNSAETRNFGWELYKSLITIKDKDERKKIEEKVLRNDWTATQLREYLSSKRKEKEPAKTDQPISQLTFTRGKVHTFQIVNAGAQRAVSLQKQGEHGGSPLRLDLGFRLHHLLPANAPKLKEADIVEVVFKDGRPSGIQKSKASADELFTYQASIDKIIDGDTLLVTLDFGEFSISQKLRLRGIDCPEIATAEGKKAKRFVESRLKGLNFIIVKTYKDRTDKFDRYLADIFYGDAQTFLNQELLDNGLAQVY